MGGDIPSSSPVTIATTQLNPTTVGVAYIASLSATGGIPPYSWLVSSGALPLGLALTPESGIISGTAKQIGQLSFGATVLDSQGQKGSATLSIAVANSPASLNISTVALPAATADIPYATSLIATGGSPPYSWTVSAGNLPGGFVLSSSGIYMAKQVKSVVFKSLVTALLRCPRDMSILAKTPFSQHWIS
ncbi:MAG TPA: Ig domain-containing protein [Candidatus Aquilonibacter sp.]|nr:Ig domain-containing protein [Candidatus Aquilonibacter sp.]